MSRRLKMLDQFYYNIKEVKIDDMPLCKEVQLDEILQGAIDKWGVEKQTVVAIEELGELIKELCKALRGDGNKEHIISEMADVKIVWKEIQMMYDVADKDVEREENYKLQRLARRIEQDE